MAEVVTLGLVEPVVNADAVELLEETLARVRAGEVEAVAIVEVRRGGEVAFNTSKTEHYHAMNSGAARLAARLALLEGD